MKLLHLDASALGAHSVSRGLTAAIVAEFVRNHPGIDVTYRDLHATPLSHWGLPAGDDDPAAAEGSKALDEFLAADVVVIGSPMYNFSVPSTLKSWIDHVAIAGQTFQYTATGPKGLLTGKAYLALSSGGIYSQGPFAPAEHLATYLTSILGFLGIADVEVVRAEGVAYGPEQDKAAMAAAQKRIGTLVAA